MVRGWRAYYRMGIPREQFHEVAAWREERARAATLRLWSRLYGGHGMDHLPLLERRGVSEMFGWRKVVSPTSFGRFLRKAGRKGSKAIDRLLVRWGDAVDLERFAAPGFRPAARILIPKRSMDLRSSEGRVERTA
jgi:hypothetical protein